MSIWSKATLQWRLTVSLLLTTGLVWLVVLVMTWVETEHELSELLDAHLAQTAALLAAKTGDGHADDFTTTPILHKYQPRVAFQIWHEDQLIVQSALAPSVALAPFGSEGVSDFVHENAAWRVFATQGNAADVWVVVAELQSARNDILEAGLRSALGPVLLGLPALALLIWWVVFHALSPLRSLSQTVSQRHPHSLEKLDVDAVSVEVQPLVQALNRLFEKMALQMESERRFNADAAHELRTPIAAIRMHAQVAQGAEHSEDLQVALKAVLQGCDRATRLVAQLLQMSRLSADEVHDGQARCEVVSETRSTLAALAPRAEIKAQTLSLQAPDALVLSMPPGLVSVLVGNLVDNAQRYSPQGAHIQVQWLASPVPSLVVQDDGPGMSEFDMARLGDRFFRVPGNQAEGSGLGWSIVRRLAQSYGLNVKVESPAEQGGLRVTVSWPLPVTGLP
jgi:two-component system sensor histidine kinase QseC